MEKLIERFLRYVKVDTASDADSPTSPSTHKQYEFGKTLVTEMLEIGLEDAHIDENGYIMATLPGNTKKDVPVVAFIAHMDTVDSVPTENIAPQIVENYNGGKILLNKKRNIFMSPEEFPSLNNYVGQDLITTDGTTLLGADDKAGIAEILTAMEYLIQHPEIEHGTIKVAFTPDEEISRGTDHFDVDKFGADFGYTLDGGELGEVEYENFNAAMVKVTINGKNIHPGAAKNQMKNSLLIAMELNAMLPSAQRPAHTEEYEGFFHLNHIEGNVETSYMKYLIRDHDKQEFEEKKERMQSIVDYLNFAYGEGTVELDMKDQYYNMKEKIKPVMHIIETAKEAMRQVGVEPLVAQVRGGTDGARLSYMGLPCPNLFTGGHNYHGKFEYIPISSMRKAVEVILKIIEIYTNK